MFTDDDFKDLKKSIPKERIICDEAIFFKSYLSDRGIRTAFVARKINFTPQRLSDVFCGLSSKMSNKMRASLMAYLKLSEQDLPENIRK